MTARRASAARPWIDLREFAREGGELGAAAALADLPRLASLLADDVGGLDWRLTGEQRPRAEGGTDAFLALRLRGRVRLGCVRCLEPVEVELDESRRFKVAATETQAEREDADAEEYDVLSQVPRFDVLELVEDEAIMALPIAPRHTDCALPAQPPAAPGARPGREAEGGSPREAGPAAEDDTARPNPFAVLESLRRRGRSNGDEG